MKLEEAQANAEAVAGLLDRLCLSVLVVGSVRRECAECKDVELLCVPNMRSAHKLARVVNGKIGTVKKGRFPSRYTCISGGEILPYRPCNIDLFWANHRNLPMLTFIRTGPAEFVKGAFGDWKKRNGGRGMVKDCQMLDGNGSVVPIETEKDVFKVLGATYLPPERRFSWQYSTARAVR